MKVWTVMAQKGGVGKTTTVINMAGALAARGAQVLVVDLDPHGSLTSYLGFDPDAEQPNVHHLFAAAADARECDISRLPRTTAIARLSLLASTTALVTLERRCGATKGMGRVLARQLPRLADRFDYVLVDCPPTLGMLVINACAAAEQLIVPMQTEDLALRSLDRLVRTLEVYRKSSGRSLPHLVVPTMFDRRTRAARDSLLRLRHRDDITLWADYIPVDTQIREASRIGQPLTCWQPQARASEAYERLVDTLTRQHSQQLRSAG